MTIGEYIRCSIDDFEHGEKFNSSLLHACISIDGTASKLFPTHGNKKRFVETLRKYYWLLEPMVIPGINLVETRFSMINLLKNNQPDFAEIIYEIFRCNLAHGTERPENYKIINCVGSEYTEMHLSDEYVHFPDTIVFGLLSISISSEVNKNNHVPKGYFITLGNEKFIINDWWGREEDFKEIAEKYNKTRVKIEW